MRVAIAAHRALVPCRTQIADRDRRRRRFLVGDDGVARTRALRHVEGRPGTFRRRGQRREAVLDHRRDRLAVDVADDDDGHQIRAIPVAIEAEQLLALRALDDLGLADRGSIGVARSLQLHLPQLVRRPLACAEVHAPFREHDAALPLDRLGIERRGLGPVLEHEHRAVEDARHVGRHAQQVLRVVVARLRVRIRSDADAERRQELADPLLREVPRALEQHVLDEMRQALLVVVFEHRSGLDDQPELGAPRRLGILPHVIAQAVRQRADGDFGIDGHLLRERVGADRLRRRFAPRRRALAGGRGPRGGEQGGHDTAEGDTNARESHMSILPDGRRSADGRPEIANFVSRQ